MPKKSSARRTGPPQKISVDGIDNYRIFDVQIQTWRYDGGVELERDIIKIHTNPVLVLPVTEEGRIVLIRQYRETMRGEAWGLPAGRKDPVPGGGIESASDAGIRELKEETGYVTSEIEIRPSSYSSPGITDQKVDFIIARNVKPGERGPASGEYITATREVTIEKALKMLEDGEIAGQAAQNAIRDYAIIGLQTSHQDQKGSKPPLDNEWSSTTGKPVLIEKVAEKNYKAFKIRIENWGINGKQKERDIIEVRNAVVILPLAIDGSIILIRHHRPAIEKEIWELPAGKIDPKQGGGFETPLSAAVRELSEETGYEAGKIVERTHGYSMNGMCTEILYNFTIEAKNPGPQHLEAGEAINEIRAVTWQKVLEMIESGEIDDQKTQNAVRGHIIRILQEKRQKP